MHEHFNGEGFFPAGKNCWLEINVVHLGFRKKTDSTILFVFSQITVLCLEKSSVLTRLSLSDESSTWLVKQLAFTFTEIHIIDMLINSLNNSFLKTNDFFGCPRHPNISWEGIWMSIYSDLETPLKTASFLVVAWLVVLNNRGLAACAKGSQWLRSLQALQMFARATVENRQGFLGMCARQKWIEVRNNKWHGKERYV